ncbi:MAG: chromosomal replication initiator protein DnaA [Candidatus Saccharibacteria bacterium]|nr:chromosomal replication initiator protein DnaA [Candidatus Saccharibacteria bacterium]
MQESAGIWQAVLGEIELTISRGNFVTWFKNTHLLEYTPERAVIGVANVFIKQQLERKYTELLKDVLGKNGVAPTEIIFDIYSSPSAKSKRSTDDSVMLSPQTTKARKTESKNSGVSHNYRLGLNSRYTFDTFIVGGANELAYAACQAIAQKPGEKYNPLFLYGGVGIGKTHLIQAVGNEILKNNPSAHIVYISTEQFIQEFLDAIRFKKNTDFAGYYRSADVLIVDDIQFIAGKEKTQEEFFHTFNALHQANKQIIISSDKPPRDIPTLEERLKSRFAWGMSIDMQTPDFETRCAIVQSKAQGHGLKLPADVVELLANLVHSNIRELEGVLNQLLAYCEMRDLEPDIKIAELLFSGSNNRPKHITAKQVLEHTARYYSIELGDLMSPKRDKEIVVPRQIAMHLLRTELKLSFPKIARECGRKDHTTAIHAVDKITKELVINPQLRQQVVELKGRIYV